MTSLECLQTSLRSGLRPWVALLLLGCLSGDAAAQNAATVLRENPTIQGLPAYVLNGETRISQHLWNQQIQDAPFLMPSTCPEDAVIQYLNRENQPVNQQQFLQDVLQLRNHGNLP